MMTPFQAFDALLIAPFRLLPSPEAGFLLGSALLALASAALGQASKALVAHAHRVRRASQDGETKKRHELSIQAAQAGNKDAYLAQNHLAQEHYGNSLALSAGRGAALLWPGMIALAWLSWRFDGVAMPYLWDSAGPVTVFLPLYIAALWGLARLGPQKASNVWEP
ncbi:MAG: hypothetical protein Q7U56_02430 [Humidesulfovibrio sp.]|nr:hypothetical protein [Humidesulfovibrio sp.]